MLVAGCTVQGREAAADVLRAVELLVEDGRAEMIVVTRGGGSKSDLVAFQDEQLARYLAQVPVPVLSAVGHQIDTSLCDLVADAVAATPSDAALMALPDGQTLSQQVDDWLLTLDAAVARLIAQKRAALDATQARLRHPGQKFAQLKGRTQELLERLQLALRRQVEGHRVRADAASGRLVPAAVWHLERKSQRLSALEGRLQALSPFAVLERGYSIVSGPKGVVTDAAQAEPGEALTVRVHKGSFEVEVVATSKSG